MRVRNHCCRLTMIICFIVMLWIAGARGEPSANLKKVEEIGKQSHRVELVSYYDMNGNPAFADDLGYASIRYTYNRKPRCIRTECFDLDGNLVMCKDGYAVITQKWDGNGRQLEKYYWDENENPVIGPEGYHAVLYKYDHRKLVKINYLDTKGEPLDSDRLPSKILYSYDAKGRGIKDEYFGPDDEYKNNAKGYAWTERAYEKNKNLSSEFFYDKDGNLVYVKSKQYAGFKKTVNIRNQVERIEYFGADGKPIMYQGKYAYVIYDYQYPYESPIRETYYDAEGNLILQKGGYAAIEYTYISDYATRPMTIAYLGTDGERVMIPEGYSKVSRRYLKNGQITDELYYDTEDFLMINPVKGYAGVKREYSSGKLISETFLDTNREPMILPGGYCTIKYEYDKKKVTGVLYLDENGKAVVSSSGSAGERRDYDEDGHLIELTYVDENGDPTRGPDGYATEKRTYYTDEIQTIRYYNADESPTTGKLGAHLESYSYDVYGEVAEVVLYNSQGNLMNGSQGWARYCTMRNEKKKVIRTAFYDAEGNPVDGPDGFAIKETDYNEAGKQTRVKTVVVNPENAESVIPEVINEYNEAGLLESTRYEDGVGHLIPTKKGYSVVQYRYNEQGQKTVTTYLDENMAPASQGEGYCGTVNLYDAEGNGAGLLYLDGDGDYFRLKNGAYGVNQQTKKNEAGKKQTTDTIWLNQNGEIVLINDGYAATHTVYNDQEQIVSMDFFDCNMEPCADTSGKYGVRYEWNSEGKRSETGYVDQNGKLINTTDGYCRIVYEYAGGKTTMIYYDTDGNEVKRK